MFDRHRPADDASMCREVVIAHVFSILFLTGNVDAVHAFEHRRSDCKKQAGLAWGCFGGIAMAFLLFALCVLGRCTSSDAVVLKKDRRVLCTR